MKLSSPLSLISLSLYSAGFIMGGLVTDSFDIDELKLPSSPAADCTAVPSINDLDFSEPLFDSLPDFDTLKDYWIYQSVGIEEVVGMSGDVSGVEVKHGGLNESESLSLVGVKVEDGENGDLESVMKGKCEGDKVLDFGGVGVEVDGNEEALKKVESAVKLEVGESRRLSPDIEADLRKVSLDGPVDASVAENRIDVKGEGRGDGDESDSSSESEKCKSSEDSSSEDTSSSDDEDGEDVVVKIKGELAS